MDKTEFSIEILKAAFAEASIVARIASEGDDKGSCNTDTAVLLTPYRYRKHVHDAAIGTGLQVRERRWSFYGLCFFIDSELCGQASKNTRIAEAIKSAFISNGLEATVYYEMD